MSNITRFLVATDRYEVSYQQKGYTVRPITNFALSAKDIITELENLKNLIEIIDTAQSVYSEGKELPQKLDLQV